MRLACFLIAACSLVFAIAKRITPAIPLVLATGPGKTGNRTIGSAAAGGMLFGTVFGVLIIPGLYYIFARIAERNPLIKDEEENPLTEAIDYNE